MQLRFTGKSTYQIHSNYSSIYEIFLFYKGICVVLAKKNEQVKDNLYSISLGVMETLKDIFYYICLSYVIGNRKKDVQATYASSFPKAFPCNLSNFDQLIFK